MSGSGIICLQSYDQVKLINEVRKVFHKYKIKIDTDKFQLEKTRFGKTEKISFEIYSYDNHVDNFLKKKIEIDNSIKLNRDASIDTRKVLRVKHSKVIAYLYIQSEQKLDKKFRNSVLEILKVFKGIFIENNNLFFDDTGCVLLDEDGDREYVKVEDKLEKETPICYRFYAERKLILNGFGITKEIPYLKIQKKHKSEEEICKRIVALIVSTIKADDLHMGHSMAVANESARNVMKMFKSKRDWFTEQELEFLGSSRPSKEQIEYYAKGYDSVLALLFLINLVDKFDFPMKKGNYDILLDLLTGIDSFDMILNNSRVRENSLLYLNIAYFSEWNAVEEIESNKTKEKINVEVAKGWHKALRWYYFNEEKW